MSTISKLIDKFCPDGVEYKYLGDITSSVNIGVNPRKFFKLNPNDATGFYVTVRELNGLRGVKQFDKTDKLNQAAVDLIQNRANIEKGDILFSNTGTVGKMALVTSTPKNWGVNEGVYVIKPIHDVIQSRFLYYYLDSNHAYSDYSSRFTGATLQHVTQKALREIIIPVPPIEVQQEIVRILDTFTNVIDNLNRELVDRKKQFVCLLDNYYGSSVDDLKNKCTHKGYKLLTIADLGSLTRGRRFVRNDIVEVGTPCIHYGDLYTYYGISATKAKTHIKPELAQKLRFAQRNDVVIVGAGENNEDIGVGVAWLSNEPVVVHDACYILHHSQNPKYISYYLRSFVYHHQIKKYVVDGKICAISAKGIGKTLISVPSTETQNRIADHLDKVDFLLHNISSEIELRQKQYEYYRDQLLNFKRKA